MARCRLSPGSWQPAVFLRADATALVWASIVQAWLRAWDYLTPITGGTSSRTLSLVERAAPLSTWGAAFAGGAAVLTWGVLQRRHLMVWLGHQWLRWAYTILAIGILIPCLAQPYLDGIRGATVLLLPIAFHWIMARRTGPKPVQHKRAHPVETIGEPE